ncbi:MAG: tetratricopeptide repeat protein [Gemmatimonadales bacterium]|nr:MAG: tetratricopeptide repeat protein [Gemmatimonadales bacterium]
MSAEQSLRAAAALAVMLLLAGAGTLALAGVEKVPKTAKIARPVKTRAVAAPADTSQVLVRIGGQAVTAEDVRRRLEEIPESARRNFMTPEGRQQLLERMVEERVWLVTAQESGVADRPQVMQQLAQQRRDLLIRTYLNETMSANPAPPDSEARAYYDSHLSEYRTPAGVTLRHVHTKTEAQARQVLKLAQSGQDWAKLVQKYSVDTLTRAQSGSLGTVTREGLFPALGRQPALAESAFALGAGKTGGPFKTDRGWHVLKVEELRPEGARPFDSVKPMIMRQLGNQRGQEFYRQLLDQARQKLGVTPDSAAIKKFVSQKRDVRELFKMAQELGPPAERIAAYRALLDEYPDSDVSPQAQFMVGFIHSEELKDYDGAEQAFRELLKRYPGSELTGSAQWMVDHMRSEEAPAFDLSEADSSRGAPRPQGAAKGSSGKP